MKIILGWLYPKLMNLYGDRGNVIALQYRCKKRHIDFEVKNIEIGQRCDLLEIDILFFGGGQDKEQIIVGEDLIDRKKDIENFYNNQKPMLAICGGYQLLGKYFLTKDNNKIKGIGLLDFYTVGGDKRMIGDIVIKSTKLNMVNIVGFENHSGKTYLGKELESFGEVIKGFGNNGEDEKEGVFSKNFVGIYMHGPILPKNPDLTDWFIQKTLEKKYNKKIILDKINDDLEYTARDFIIKNK